MLNFIVAVIISICIAIHAAGIALYLDYLSDYRKVNLNITRFCVIFIPILPVILGSYGYIKMHKCNFKTLLTNSFKW